MSRNILTIFEGSRPQLLAVIPGTLNAVCDGMQYAWTSPIIPCLKSKDSPVKINHKDGFLLESTYMWGALTSLPLAIYLLSKHRRKHSILLMSFAGILGWSCLGLTKNVKILLLSRFFLGLTGDVAFNTCSVYSAEVASPKIRGFLSGMVYIMVLTGTIIMYSTGPFLPIYGVSMVGISILLIQLCVFPFQPESPYYLVSVGKYKEAELSLKRLRTRKDITEELDDIIKAVERQKKERGRPQDLIMIRSNRRAIIAVTLLNFNEHFAGFTVLTMSVHDILNRAGSNVLSSSSAAIIFSVLMLVAATASIFAVDRFGRKKLLKISGVCTFFTLFAIAVFFHLKTISQDVENFAWVPMISILLYAVTFKIGIGIVPIIMTAELFPTSVKSMGVAFSDMVFLGTSALSIYFYDIICTAFGIHVAFYSFSISVLISTALIQWYVPETKGKTLEQIQMILKE